MDRRDCTQDCERQLLRLQSAQRNGQQASMPWHIKEKFDVQYCHEEGSSSKIWHSPLAE